MMTPDEDNLLPPRLQNRLHDLVPSAGEPLSSRETDFLAQARAEIRRSSARRIGWRQAGAIAMAASLLIAAAGVWYASAGRNTSPNTIALAAHPTIVDVLRAAKQPGAKQEDLDRLAMAAVRLDPAEVRR